jgi:hypothetical protein
MDNQDEKMETSGHKTPIIEFANSPDGTRKPLDDASKEWYAFAAPMETLGFRLLAYAPTLLFENPGTETTFEMPVSAVRRINEALAGNPWVKYPPEPQMCNRCGKNPSIPNHPCPFWKSRGGPDEYRYLCDCCSKCACDSTTEV